MSALMRAAFTLFLCPMPTSPLSPLSHVLCSWWQHRQCRNICLARFGSSWWLKINHTCLDFRLWFFITHLCFLGLFIHTSNHNLILFMKLVLPFDHTVDWFAHDQRRDKSDWHVLGFISLSSSISVYLGLYLVFDFFLEFYITFMIKLLSSYLYFFVCLCFLMHFVRCPCSARLYLSRLTFQGLFNKHLQSNQILIGLSVLFLILIKIKIKDESKANTDRQLIILFRMIEINRC